MNDIADPIPVDSKVSRTLGDGEAITSNPGGTDSRAGQDMQVWFEL
jgi:hypothetical protein